MTDHRFDQHAISNMHNDFIESSHMLRNDHI